MGHWALFKFCRIASWLDKAFSQLIKPVSFWIPKLVACMFLNFDLQYFEQRLIWLIDTKIYT